MVGDGVYVVQLVDLLVSLSYRRRGIAKKMVLELARKFKQTNKDSPIMLVDGSGITGFYESMGFVEGTSEKVFYQEMK